MKKLFVVALTVPLLAFLQLRAMAAEPAAPPGCTLVVGGGRTPLSDDAQLIDHWNRLNFSFFDAAAEAVRASDSVEQAFFPVGSVDAAKNIETLLGQVARAGCTRIAFFSVFSDQAQVNPELVFSVRVSPIRQSRRSEDDASAPAMGFSVGAVEYEREYRFPATPASLDKVRPSRIADQAVRDYRASRRRTVQ